MYRALIELIVGRLACKIIFIRNTQLLTELLQFTVAASHAGKAFLIMIG